MNVDVVIVTYNRLEKLKKALRCYEEQTQSFRNLIVVNNHSFDGTEMFLQKWKECKTSQFGKYVITTKDNLGGAGGFYYGEKLAMSMNPDWIFIADDDAYPEPDMMEKFYEFSNTHKISDYSAVCAAVLFPNKSVACEHRSRFIADAKGHFSWDAVPLEEYQQEFFNIDFLSYVGPFLNAKAIQNIGFVNRRFFIYNDDSEHSLRLRHYGQLICVPKIKIVHDVKQVGQYKGQNPNDNMLVTWGDYYTNRNEMYMFKKHLPKVAKVRFKTAFKRHLKGLDKTAYEKVVWKAVRDAWLGRLGKHKIFQPGWSIKA